MTETRISVVLPVFNERDNIAPCLAGLWRALADVEHEILVCYDFDEDTTLAGIRAMGDAAPRTVRLVKNTLGRGPHKAIQAGFQAASGDVVVTTMADLSDPPEVILPMAAAIRAGAAVVSGSRYMPGGSQQGGPLLKRTLSRIAGVSLAWVANVGTCDATSNFRAYSKKFLDTTTIEATAGFEIALELTVKAHLAGAGVGEVPSSWVDRTAGESRFRLWKWLPNYLRWYLRAMREPLAVWGAWLVALSVSLARLAPGAGELAHIGVWTWAGSGALALCAARAVRGRNRWADFLLVAAWFAPPLVLATGKAAAFSWALRVVASVVILGATSGWSQLGTALRRIGLPRSASMLAWALLALLVWSTHASWMQRCAGSELDLSWQQSLGRALREEHVFGREILFTYGPLGYFLESPYDPALFWTRTLVFGVGFQLFCTAIVLAAIRQLASWPARVALALLVPVVLAGHDAWSFFVCAAAAAWYLARPNRSVFVESLVTFALAVLALTKFTYLLYAGCVWTAFAFHGWRTSGPVRALRTPLIALTLVAGLWVGLGQPLGALPAYVSTSFEITAGYSAGMAVGGELHSLQLACFALLLTGVACALHVANVREATLTFVIAVGAFLAFKAGFVRSLGNAVTFFGFIALAPFLLDAGSERTVATRAPSRLRRSARFVVALAITGIAIEGYGIAREAGDLTWVRLWTDARGEFDTNVPRIADPLTWREDLVTDSEAITEQTALPNVRAAVGDATIDVIGNSQGVAHTNGLRWTPRPVFQSYLAYTSALSRRNAEFLAGPDAPRFLLFGIEAIDGRLPGSEDALALQIMARDYRAVLEEGPYMLLERDTSPRPSAPPREVQIDRDIAFDEWIDIDGLLGDCHVLSLDVRPTWRSRWKQALFRVPPVWISIEDSQGRSGRFRVVIATASDGILVDPFVISSDDRIAWFSGGETAHITRVRLETDRDLSGDDAYEPLVRVRVTRADDLVPRAAAEIPRVTRFPMLKVQPDSLVTRFPWYPAMVGSERVLVVQAPSELAFVVERGTYHIRARYGILPRAWQQNCTDGVNFIVVTFVDDKTDKLEFKRLLDPVGDPAHREPQTLDLVVTVDRASPIALRTRPGPRADTECDFAYWTAIEIVPVTVPESAPENEPAEPPAPR